ELAAAEPGRLQRALAVGEDLEPHSLAVTDLPDVRALGLDLHAAALAAAHVAREHDRGVTALEVVLRLAAPGLPRAQPGVPARVRRRRSRVTPCAASRARGRGCCPSAGSRTAASSRCRVW